MVVWGLVDVQMSLYKFHIADNTASRGVNDQESRLDRETLEAAQSDI